VHSRNSRYLHPVKKLELGLLGGGQLARMLALSAHPLGVQLGVLTEHATDPAAQVTSHAQIGSLKDPEALKLFLRGHSAITFESEFVDTDLVQRTLPAQTYVFPNLAAIAQIQDRLTQKQLLDQFKVPTSDWMAVTTPADLREAEQKWPKGFVLKQRRNGYDGYGTFVYKNGKGLDADLMRSPHGFIAERWIPFRRELAVLFVRSRNGEFLTLPLVETHQVNSRCLSVHGPVRHPQLKNLAAKARKLMNQLDYVGLLAFELFDDGKLILVNELAPRVHNSGHYSLDALTCSQFEYHVRAGLGLPLPPVRLRSPGFAMVNLLGEGAHVKLSYKAIGQIHWYGKQENRMGRKMGHITVLDRNPRQALARALKWRKDFQL